MTQARCGGLPALDIFRRNRLGFWGGARRKELFSEIMKKLISLIILFFSNSESAEIPKYPDEDPTIFTAKQIATRGSEIVDLGFPPGISSNSEQVDCPHHEQNLVIWDETNVVPENSKVLVTRSVSLKGVLRIPSSSELIFDDVDLELRARGIRIMGALRAGGERCKRRSSLEITIFGDGDKGIEVVDGILDLHGVDYGHTWSRLAATADPGDRILFLQDLVNWDPGQKVVVVGTQLRDSRDWHQNEVVEIASAAAASHLGLNVTAVSLASPLKFNHYGGPEYQAEVGLLSRRIVIQGDEASEPVDNEPLGCEGNGYSSYPCANHLTGHGAHIIVQGVSPVARVFGVELRRMGQTNQEGRYPMHFHLLGDAGSESYFEASSVWRSYFRCVSIHGTHGVTVRRNVAFDIIGHCLYLEDGVETNNLIEFNLHAHIHPIGIPPGNARSSQFLDPIHQSEDLFTPPDSTASGFYLSNADNVVRGNAAVGGYSGFHFPLLRDPIRLHRYLKGQVTPFSSPTKVFDGNSCHSSGWWWGHGACIYFGGVFEEVDETTTVYNPGRDVSGHRTCETKNVADYGYNCPSWPAEETCAGQSPRACDAFMTVTNFKAALTRSALMHWGKRVRVEKLEVYDFYMGPAFEVFGEATIDQALVVCRTPNTQHHPCDVDHHGENSSSPCNDWDLRFWTANTNAVTWYDTGTSTLLTNTTFRDCDPASWSGCRNDCLQSSTFKCLTHSNKHLPEWMSLTANLRFQGSVNPRLVDYSRPNPPSISGRTQNWYDFDGSACRRDEPMIVGSNNDAGTWWHIDDDCEPTSNEQMVCCPARGKLPAGVTFEWDEALQSMVERGELCDNSGRTAHADCPVVGYLTHFGRPDFSSQGLKVMPNAEVVGAADGFGWYFHLLDGAPRRLTLSRIQVHHDSTLMLAIPYTKETSFEVSMEANRFCRRSCRFLYEQAANLDEVRRGAGNLYYFDDDDGTLYLRIVQRLPNTLSDTEGVWDASYQVSTVTNSWMTSNTDGFGLPIRTEYPKIVISADCEPSTVNDAYCADPVATNVPMPCGEEDMTNIGECAGDCVDSRSWHKNRNPSKDCSWVSQQAPTRCAVTGEDGSSAYESCEYFSAEVLLTTFISGKVTCGACPAQCRGDDDTFRIGDGGCGWVAEAQTVRCRKFGNDGTLAYEKCPHACDICTYDDCPADNPAWHLLGDNETKNCELFFTFPVSDNKSKL